MLSLYFTAIYPVTRARKTSNELISAAALAVVSVVNPDKPGAFLFRQPFALMLTTFAFLVFSAKAVAAPPPYHHLRTPLNNAIYNNSVIEITPLLFHHLEVGMSYRSVVQETGRSPLYCDSGYSTCNAENGSISESCLEHEFVHHNKTWMCHWDGERTGDTTVANLNAWFYGNRLVHVVATMPNGNIYRRDSSNTVHFERAVHLTTW